MHYIKKQNEELRILCMKKRKEGGERRWLKFALYVVNYRKKSVVSFIKICY